VPLPHGPGEKKDVCGDHCVIEKSKVIFGVYIVGSELWLYVFSAFSVNQGRGFTFNE
jgi:hypothetical protein